MTFCCEDEMREDILIEEIAARLYNAGCATGGASPSTRKRARFWKAQAVEAIRLMEWSRRELTNYDVDDNDPPPSTLRYEPLTLPPPDWNP